MSRSGTCQRHDAGFSLIELTLLLVVVSAAMLGIASGILAAQQTGKEVRQESELLDHAGTLSGQIQVLPHGTGGVASASQIADLIAREGPQSGNPRPSIRELAGASPMTWTYIGQDTLASGVWQITVDSDLNGDGDTADPLEGTGDVMRICVRFQDRILSQIIRSRGPQE